MVVKDTNLPVQVRYHPALRKHRQSNRIPGAASTAIAVSCTPSFRAQVVGALHAVR